MGATDPVDNPDHYTAGGIESIDAIRSMLTREEFVAYCRGNVMKYVWRCMRKGGLQDLKKARVYLTWAIEALDQP